MYGNGLSPRLQPSSCLQQSTVMLYYIMSSCFLAFKRETQQPLGARSVLYSWHAVARRVHIFILAMIGARSSCFCIRETANALGARSIIFLSAQAGDKAAFRVAIL
jgi:hypothetical protein